MKFISNSENQSQKGKSIIILIVILSITAAFFYGGYYYKSWELQKQKEAAEEKRSQASVNSEIYITSEPSEAVIEIDGKDTGKTTPAFLTDLQPGKHIINLTSDNTYPWNVEAELKEREFLTIQAEMNEKE